MNILVPVALFGWIPAVLVLFSVLPSRRAVVVAFVVGWLFLPTAGYAVSGLPDYTKVTAVNVAALIGSLMFDSNLPRGLRPHWADLPIAVWCLVPFATSVSNGLGAYDGMSTTLDRLITWGLPYLLGRFYFRDLSSARMLALGIFFGGLVYMPLCLWEIKMSPQLNGMLYGFRRYAFYVIQRFGGWRPDVFMSSALMVGMWMTAAALLGVWLLRRGSLPARWGGLSMKLLVITLVATAVLGKCFGALVILLAGILVLETSRRLNSRIPLVGLLIVPVFYMVLRASGVWSGESIARVVEIVSKDRAESMRVRLENEDILAKHAMRRPLFGWGGFSRNRPADTDGQTTITDGYWIIALGTNGFCGLVAFTAIHMVPPWLVWRLWPPRGWRNAALAAPAGLAVILNAYLIDNLMNAMFNPIYVLIAGGLTSTVLAYRPIGIRVASQRQRVRPSRPGLSLGIPRT